MPLYMVEQPHTPEECMAAFEGFSQHPRAEELLKNTYAACNSGTHIAWTAASFKDEDEAREMVSLPELKNKMKIYPVDVFSLEEMKGAHES